MFCPSRCRPCIHPYGWPVRTATPSKSRQPTGLALWRFHFSIDPEEARTWSSIYYDIIKSDACVPLGHAVNANLAMVSAFSLHEDRAEAIRRGQDHFEFFRYSQQKLVAEDFVPGYSNMWEEFLTARGDASDRLIQAAQARAEYDGAGIGTPKDMSRHLKALQEAGVDQVVFLQQAGRNSHKNICESLQLFADQLMPQFKADAEAREARKAAELQPYIEAELIRKTYMQPLSREETPVIKVSVRIAGEDGRKKS